MKALAFSGGKDSMACLHLELATLDCAIYIDTGFAYPETKALVEYASALLPVHIIQTDRAGQNEFEGIPADVVPIDWTRLGHITTGRKPALIQSYIGCCYENIAQPLFETAKRLGVTHLVYGQRNDETHKASAVNGDVIGGITRLHPIETWTAKDVLAYLATVMDVPAHYVIGHSSLDCYDCTAFARESSDRVEWMRKKHPALYAGYKTRHDALGNALMRSL